jgi:putative tryptophan/tyrosine transport system substrate-binding protein
MRRREFIGLAGAAAVWPLAARAQQSQVRLVGFLSGRSQQESSGDAAAFLQGLQEMGYVEGRNLALEYRWAEGRSDRLPELAGDLLRRGVVVIAAVGGNSSAFAAKAASPTIPIVFTSGADPIRVGLVASLNRPGGSVTGVSWFAAESVSKLVEVLAKLVPNITRAALLVNPNSPELAGQPETAQRAAQELAMQLRLVEARSETEIDAAFADAKRQDAEAVIVSTDPYFRTRHEQIIALAAHHRLPTSYFARDFVTAGGLVSYGNSLPDAYRRAGVQTGRILRGAKPAELPVDRATKFELVVNLKTAKTLGIEIPATLLALADELIE